MLDLGAATGFLVVFAVVGGLELFDRTSFALIALATRSHAWGTWLGGVVAFALSSAIAVGIGAGLAAVLGGERVGLLRVAGGAFLLAYAAWLYFHPESEEHPTLRETRQGAFVAAFATLFVLELGDTTMIFELVFVSTWGWLVVLLAGTLALVCVAAWDVAFGRWLGGRIRPATLHPIVVAILAIVGVVTVLYGLFPAAFPSL